MRCRKWYHRIVVHLVSLALINPFTVYRYIVGTEPLFDFQLNICCCLLKADQWIDADEDITNPVWQSRYFSVKSVNHWSRKCEKASQCKKSGCNKRTCFLWWKCQVYLCVLFEYVRHFENLYANWLYRWVQFWYSEFSI